MLSLAGTMPDCQVARQLRCTSQHVLRVRRAAGIPKFDSLADFMDAIGILDDAEVARLAGVSTRYVRTRRERLGIVPAG